MNSIQNVISIDSKTHRLISAFYSRKHDIAGFVNTGNLTFRDWLNPKSFQDQYEWGLKILRMLGVDV